MGGRHTGTHSVHSESRRKGSSGMRTIREGSRGSYPLVAVVVVGGRERESALTGGCVRTNRSVEEERETSL